MGQFSTKRGMVLHTTRAINVKTEDGTSHKVPSGTRVKAMSLTDKGGIKVKIQDKNLPALKGVHVETGFSNVKQVERGRPAESKPAAKKTAAKTTAKKTAKKSTKPAAEYDADEQFDAELNGTFDANADDLAAD